VYDIGVVKVFQSPDGVRELKDVQQATKEKATIPYEHQVIASVITDVLHNVAIGHPFGDRGEPSILKGIRNSNKAKDIWMRQGIPQDDFFTEAL